MVLEEFKELVGKDSYPVFIDLLKKVGRDARTHRIRVVFAAILRYASEKLSDKREEGSLRRALTLLEEDPSLACEESEEYAIVYELIAQICHETGIRNERQSARGQNYSIANLAIAEFASWYNMPWEY